MHVFERFTRAVLPPKWLNFRMRRLSLLVYISLYSRQGPASSVRYKRRVEGRPSCTILCTLTGLGRRFLASILWISWMSYLINKSQGGSLVACTRNKELRERT